MFDALKRDLDAVLARDPAVHSRAEVFFCYPGFKAVRSHRRAHKAYLKGHYLLARLINFHSYQRTGIDIHPGAKLGQGVFIDHGTGVVIGETAEVGDDVTIYQGATLGGTGKDVGKRHPTIGNNVLIGTGAKVLGPITIGSGSRVAANSVVLKDIPENSTAVGIPARVVRLAGQKIDYVKEVDHVHDVPDPITSDLAALREELARLKHRESELEMERPDDWII